jgi:hypothetical protein
MLPIHHTPSQQSNAHSFPLEFYDIREQLQLDMSGERGVSVCKIAEGERCVDFHDFGTFSGVNDFEADGVGDVQAGDCWRGAQVF